MYYLLGAAASKAGLQPRLKHPLLCTFTGRMLERCLMGFRAGCVAGCKQCVSYTALESTSVFNWVLQAQERVGKARL